MSIFRGSGGASEATTDIYASTIQQYAVTATTKASEASISAQSAEETYDDFDDRYLGSKASDPSTDNDGDPLQTGALYFNTTTDNLKVWSGSAWLDATSPAGGVYLTQTTADTLYEPKLNDVTRQKFYRSSNPPPTADLLEGDMWYKTDTEDIYFWREVGIGVFNWVLFSTGTDNSDTLDGGHY
jgi:hypothetical protein